MQSFQRASHLDNRTSVPSVSGFVLAFLWVVCLWEFAKAALSPKIRQILECGRPPLREWLGMKLERWTILALWGAAGAVECPTSCGRSSCQGVAHECSSTQVWVCQARESFQQIRAAQRSECLYRPRIETVMGRRMIKNRGSKHLKSLAWCSAPAQALSFPTMWQTWGSAYGAFIKVKDHLSLLHFPNQLFGKLFRSRILISELKYLGYMLIFCHLRFISTFIKFLKAFSEAWNPWL